MIPHNILPDKCEQARRVCQLEPLSCIDVSSYVCVCVFPHNIFPHVCVFHPNIFLIYVCVCVFPHVFLMYVCVCLSKIVFRNVCVDFASAEQARSVSAGLHHTDGSPPTVT